MSSIEDQTARTTSVPSTFSSYGSTSTSETAVSGKATFPSEIATEIAAPHIAETAVHQVATAGPERTESTSSSERTFQVSTERETNQQTKSTETFTQNSSVQK